VHVHFVRHPHVQYCQPCPVGPSQQNNESLLNCKRNIHSRGLALFTDSDSLIASRPFVTYLIHFAYAHTKDPRYCREQTGTEQAGIIGHTQAGRKTDTEHAILIHRAPIPLHNQWAHPHARVRMRCAYKQDRCAYKQDRCAYKQDRCAYKQDRCAYEQDSA
jgi:hypothetical protein